MPRNIYQRSKDSRRKKLSRAVKHPEYITKWTPKKLFCAGKTYNPADVFPELLNIGQMTRECKFCKALTWPGEVPSMCCTLGKVNLPEDVSPPSLLKSLFDGNSTESKHFLYNIRKYNTAFQMTSFGAKRIDEGGFMPTFKVQGQVYHMAGSLYPHHNDTPKFLQMYFVNDMDEQAKYRLNINPSVRYDLIKKLQDMLHSCNNYIQSFKASIDKLSAPDYKIVIQADRAPSGEHERRYNKPTTNEVAVILSNHSGNKRDIVIEQRNSSIKRISETHRSYDALQYPLLLPYGEDGYHFQIPQYCPLQQTFQSAKKVSACDFYAYKLMFRPLLFNVLLKGRELSNQFLVDMYAKIETERLRYIELNQKQLRADQYVHLKDAITQDSRARNVGQPVILPSSFTGGPRYMFERSQDAMCYVRQYGRPDLFITFTCNPNWQEIKDNLFSDQRAQDRHDIVARVFRLKLRKLMDAIVKYQVFGPVQCYIYSIEWQKRGLPHAHILCWLKNKLQSTDIDDLVSSELPDPKEDTVLHDIISSNMMHGPCGLLNPNSPCMRDGLCTKGYPKPMTLATITDSNGYPLYRRRSPEDGGHTTVIKCIGNNITADNRWVVPHNKFLCKVFNAHINVEVCTSIKSIKYVCKYICKGSDMAVYELSSEDGAQNEVKTYQHGRYISSNEAVWRILSFPIHERYPSVQHLHVHLENGQRVYFTNQSAAVVAENPPETTLTAFFKLCQSDTFACTLLYNQIPNFYTWDNSRKVWQRRRKGEKVIGTTGVFKSDVLGRVYTVHPSNAECYFLRLLLHVVKGPTSFRSLRTVNDITRETYRDTCNVLGLLQDDNHWDATMSDAALSDSPQQIRSLFAILLHMCEISDPITLWHQYRDVMSEDFLYKDNAMTPGITLDYNDSIYNRALADIENKLLSLPGGKRVEYYGLPKVFVDQLPVPREILKETSYPDDELRLIVTDRTPKLTPDQKMVYEKINRISENDNAHGMFFLDAPGGTGKTYLLNLILAKFRLSRKIALAVASSGIAATLLKGGRTAHSTFKLPLNLATNDVSMCNIRNGSGLASLLQETSIIVWDECTMSHKHAVEALDRTLRDLRQNDLPMGGVILLLAGDFRQTLPVIRCGTRADQVNACLKSSYLWNDVEIFSLTTNMRVHISGCTSSQTFADTLLAIGEDTISKVHPSMPIIELPETIGNTVMTQEDLISAVFPDIQTNYMNHVWLCERGILAPRNDDVHRINRSLIELIPGEAVTFKSVDTTPDIDQAVEYPVEFLNSLHPSGMPPHELSLKIGCPIMLLRNLDAPRLCNGTRLVVTCLHQYIIEAKIAFGEYSGEMVLIPRIPLAPSDSPIPFKRLQFPVVVAFAFTINKSQGQTLKVAGLSLSNPCFSHGQLYVACSRVGSPTNIYYLTSEPEQTVNIVYPEVLQK